MFLASGRHEKLANPGTGWNSKYVGDLFQPDATDRKNRSWQAYCMTRQFECLQMPCLGQGNTATRRQRASVIHVVQIWKTAAALLDSRSSVCSRVCVPKTILVQKLSIKTGYYLEAAVTMAFPYSELAGRPHNVQQHILHHFFHSIEAFS